MITNIVSIGIVIILFSIILIISSKANKDIDRYTDILIKETIIFLPIGLLMLAYQIYKSGHWGLSPGTYCYILVFYHLLSIGCIMLNKTPYVPENRQLGLAMAMVITPVATIVFLLMIFGVIK